MSIYKSTDKCHTTQHIQSVYPWMHILSKHLVFVCVCMCVVVCVLYVTPALLLNVCDIMWTKLKLQLWLHRLTQKQTCPHPHPTWSSGIPPMPKPQWGKNEHANSSSDAVQLSPCWQVNSTETQICWPVAEHMVHSISTGLSLCYT